MDAITREEWNRLHDDYRTVINGTPHVVRLDPETGATVLVPVEIAEAKPTEQGVQR